MKRTSIIAAIGLLATTLIAPSAALANDANGELCTVTTWDESVSVTIYTNYPNVIASRATREQVAHAGEFCSQVASYYGWRGADKHYDRFTDQTLMCVTAEYPGGPTLAAVYTDIDGDGRAYELCAAGGEGTDWYPAKLHTY